MKRSRGWIPVALLAIAPAEPVAAWDVDWTLGLGLEHSDNIGRRAVDPVSGTGIIPSGTLVFSEDGESVQADGRIALSYTYYDEDAAPSQYDVAALIRANWSIVPERYSWVLENYAAQSPIDQFAPSGPNNVQNTNLFVTGPTAQFRLDPVSRLRFDLRYANAYAQEDQQFDGDRGLFAARYLRQLDPLSSISANASAEAIRQDEARITNPDYERYAVYGRYERDAARFDIGADFGWNTVERDVGEDSDGPLLRLDLGYALTPISHLDFSAAHQLSDAATNLIRLQSGQPEDLRLPVTAGLGQTNTTSGQAFEESRVDAGYARTGVRTGLYVGGYWTDQDYAALQGLDQEIRGGLATVDYRLGTRSSLGVFGSTQREKFALSGLDNRESNIGIRASYQARTDLSLVGEASYAEQTSDDDLLEYDETRFFIGLVWSPGR